MSKKAWYTSTDLINAVKRSISIPTTQNTYTEDDLLELANAELFNSQIPSILEYHSEYLVYEQIIPLKDNTNKYSIPSRAIGMKLRDLFYVDSNNNMTEMSNVGLSNADFYQGAGNNYQYLKQFYIQGDEIVLLPKIQTAPTGYLLVKYYLRPNSLVLNERAGICTSFIKQITVNNVALVTGDTLTIDSSVLVADTDFVIGASDTATAANISNAINNLDLDGISANSSTSIVSISYELQSTSILVSNSAALSISSKIGIACETIPENFQDGMYIDFLQTAGGHKTYSFDIKVLRNGVSTNAVFFNASDIPENFVVGDYICEEGECIIPQIPSDLHNLLAERTAARVLKGQGDQEGGNAQLGTIQVLEQRQGTLLQNRVEGAPQKVFNKHSLLLAGKRNRIRRRF